MKEKILVSACLTGINSRYDGKNNLCQNLLDDLKDYEIILICPENDGGMTTPRLPSEIINDKVMSISGDDNTEYFNKGAKVAVSLALKYHIRYAILKAKSPSCGFGEIYDGTFSGVLKEGFGVAAKMLSDLGVTIYNENNYQDLFKGDK